MARHYIRDASRVALLTTTAAGHSHVAVFDDLGDGFTTEADGHWHAVCGCDVMPAADGHTHELTTERRHVAGEGPGEGRPCTRRARRVIRRAERREVA